MILALLISTGVLGLAFLGLAFLLLGTLRSLGVLSWRLEQLEATSPRRLGRDGLKVGKKAPDFALPDSQNGERSLHDFAGRKVLLIFTQSGCGPCHAIMPELKRLQAKGEVTVLVVNNGTLDETRKWAGVESDSLPILVQEKFSVSKRYQVFATPFAFLLNDQGIITSKGLAGSREHLGYVLRGAGQKDKAHREEPEMDRPESWEGNESILSTEVSHV